MKFLIVTSVLVDQAHLGEALVFLHNTTEVKDLSIVPQPGQKNPPWVEQLAKRPTGVDTLREAFRNAPDQTMTFGRSRAVLEAHGFKGGPGSTLFRLIRLKEIVRVAPEKYKLTEGK